MSPFFSIRECALPAEAALGAYAASGAYTDCYAVVLPRAVTQSEFVEAFYTTAVFKLERWLIARLLSRPSTDAQARQLAQGGLGSFAAWAVEQRTPNQLVLASGRTRSWLMVSASHESGLGSTKLYVGSAVVSRRGQAQAAPQWAGSSARCSASTGCTLGFYSAQPFGGFVPERRVRALPARAAKALRRSMSPFTGACPCKTLGP